MTPDAKWIAELAARLRVKPGSEIVLARDFDPDETPGIDTKEQGQAFLARGVELLAEYQPRLSAQDTWGVLVVLQAIDAGGKDGTVRHVMSGVNPQGVTVSSFKVPTPEELDHDYLWRYSRQLPGRGHIGIFNRSHYEEVLVVRVHPELLERQKLPLESRGNPLWKQRFDEINEWERRLVANGIRVVKLFLNISRDEQRRRFLQRIDDPKRHWKFSPDDVRERSFWDDYQHAFSEMLTHTSTRWAPWHVIPGDHKWYARAAAAAVIAGALIELDPQYPTVGEEVRREMQELRAGLEAEEPDRRRRGGAA